MPAKLVTGEDAQDVAAYVASGRRGARRGRGPARRRRRRAGGHRRGRERHALDPRRRQGLTYEFADAEAPAGALTIDSVNEQPADHNIAVDGNGVDEKGDVVTDGGTSTVEVDLDAGEYTFYCSVPGHREGGMEGTLTVK